VENKDPRIEYIVGNSIDDEIVEKVRSVADGKKTMIVIDGNHNRAHVKWEIHKYKEMVTPLHYLVIEDCYIDRGLYGPGEARNWFLERTTSFRQTNRCQKYLVGMTMGGWLQRVR
jgi:cephalosporin hydroxylase